jgi:hypothetical protein
MQQRAAIGYDTDFALWVEDQVAALRAGRFGDLDVTNLVEELESLTKRDRNEVLSRLTVVAVHLLKLTYQPQKASRSWRNTIRIQSREIRKVLADSPSLRRELPAYIVRAYADARVDASGETRLPIETFPPAPAPELQAALEAALTGDTSS